MPGLYLLINLGVVSIPLAFSWHGRLRFVDRWSDFGRACLIVLSGFVIWDIIFTSLGIWGFDDRFLLGPVLAGLPIEEWMFFVCIPYACVFTYHSLTKVAVLRIPDPLSITLTAAALASCIALTVLFSERLYTFTASLLTALYLAAALIRRPDWMGRLWVSFAVLIIPFVITNGILTGIRFWDYPLVNRAVDAISNHVVWYENSENLSVRLLSIPFDDFIYAFLLIGLNVALFEYFGRSRERDKALMSSPS